MITVRETLRHMSVYVTLSVEATICSASVLLS